MSGATTQDTFAVESRWSMLPEWIITHPDLTPATKIVYAALMLYANDERQAWPSRKNIATRSAVSIDTVDRAIKQLLEFGALVVEARYDDAHRQTSNRYTLRITPVKRTQAAGGGPQKPPGGGPQFAGGEGRKTTPQSRPIDPDQEEREFSSHEEQKPTPYQVYEAVSLAFEWPLLTGPALSRQLKACKNLIASGYTATDIHECALYLSTDEFWKLKLDFIAIENQMTKWVLAHRPTRNETWRGGKQQQPRSTIDDKYGASVWTELK